MTTEPRPLTSADVAAHQLLDTLDGLTFGTTAELAALAGLHRQSAERVLKRLARLGLVEQHGGEWLFTEGTTYRPGLPIDGLAVLALLERSGPMPLDDVANALQFTIVASLSWTLWLKDHGYARVTGTDHQWKAVA